MRRTDEALKLQMSDASIVYIFADKRGYSVISAVSRLENSRAGTGAGFLLAHTGTDRYSETDHVNVNQVVRYTEVGLPLPKDILDLYTEPKEESSDAREIRLGAIREYFNIV